MTLPITHSILKGELRPNILKQSLSPKDLEQLIRNARRVSQKSQLVELEFVINEVLSGLVDTEDIYAEDKKTRDAAIHVRENKIIKSNTHFNHIDYETIIDDVLTIPELKSPLQRFYNTMLDAEVLRTRLAILYLYRAVQDETFMRSTLREIFRKIKYACRDSLLWDEYQDVFSLIPIKLTHLYFTLLNTYGELFESFESPEFEDDFMDFVYGWKGEYPSKEEEAKYIQQRKIRKEIGNLIMDVPDVKSQESTSSEKTIRHKDKADKFLDGVAEYNFLEMPKIKQLGTQEKVHSLVLTMLENPGHACAMLVFLQFYEWIKEKQRVKFTLNNYEVLCSKVIMENNNNSFHTVRMSLNPKNKNAEKYRAYAYMEQVANEYVTLLNS